MASPGTFGRRSGPLHQPSRIRTAAGPSAIKKHADLAEIPVQHPSPPPMLADASAVDDELEEWKRARKKGFAIPWRPFSLMASLSFGIASFVLPDSVNDAVQWPLYALMVV